MFLCHINDSLFLSLPPFPLSKNKEIKSLKKPDYVDWFHNTVNILKTIVLNKHFKFVNHIVCELYFSKARTKKNDF